MRQRDIFSLFRSRLTNRLAAEGAGTANEGRSVLIDTSVIIDGRIADISHTGFISGTILAPEICAQRAAAHCRLARCPAPQPRPARAGSAQPPDQAGRVPVRFTDMDVPGVREVQTTAGHPGQQLNAAVITNDYNLNHVASLQGVSVLNINELANAVKAVFLHGEGLTVKNHPGRP